MILCSKCGQTFKNRYAYAGHCVHHAKEVKRKEKFKIVVACSYCGKEYRIRGIYTHIWRKHGKGINFDSNNIGYKNGRMAWNKNKTKETDERVSKNGMSVSKTFQEQIKNGTYKPHHMSMQRRNECSVRMSANNLGGKAKWYNVNDILVQGTWERDFALKLDSNKIRWSRGKAFLYIKNDKIKRYTPDFYLIDNDLYVEIKGHWWGEDKLKMKLVFLQNPSLKNRLIIIHKALYKEIMNNNNKFLSTLRYLSLVERRTENPCVIGSIPILSTTAT